MKERKAPRFFDTEERVRLQDMLKDGISLRGIGRVLGRDYSTIIREVRRGGGRKNYCPFMATDKYNSNQVIRKRGVKRIFTQEENDLIREMVDQYTPMALIRFKLGCSYETIKAYIKNNFPGYVGERISSLTERISILEDQIQILTETIREMKNDRKNN